MADANHLPLALATRVRAQTSRWLVTGAAGFIGSHLVESLLTLDQEVVGLDNFATGHRRNLEEVRGAVRDSAWSRFTFLEGDIRELEACRQACAGARHVLHQAALGSVPRSLEDPLTTHEVNCTGFLNMLIAARDAQVGSFTYAASSSTYGDEPSLPKTEDRIGKPLSPYGASKLTNEIDAQVFARCYGLKTIGLRYFNVFGPRQDPQGAYAAVVPRWLAAMVAGAPVHIDEHRDLVYNVAVGERTSLNALFEALAAELAAAGRGYEGRPVHRDFRAGDVRHSLASIDRARERLGYAPTHTVKAGLREAMPWYLGFAGAQMASNAAAAGSDGR